jgi:NTE family protein
MKRIGLCLGGGGARGLAHLGILRIVEQEQLPVSCICGTSMGAIIGACYAANPDIRAVEDAVRTAMASSMFARLKFDILKEEKGLIKKSLFKKAQDFIRYGYIHIVEETQYALFDLKKLEEIINAVLPDIDITQTRIPFSCVATDLTNCREKVFTRGSLRQCVLASAAIPGVFPPVMIGDAYYNDGGAVSVTPVKATRAMGADLVIACDVKSKIMRWDKPEKAKEIVDRCNYITGVLLNEYHLKDADAVVAPAVKHIHWIEFDQIDFLVNEGARAMKESLLEIRAKIGLKTFLDKVRDLFSWKGSREQVAGTRDDDQPQNQPPAGLN